jgi:alkylation response protein AidB-like acyl-CoA dehydrogenase
MKGTDRLPVGPMLTDEQLTLADIVDRLLARLAPRTGHEHRNMSYDDNVWSALADVGVLDAALVGDATLIDLAVVAEAVGAHLAPVPWAEAVAASRLLVALGADPGSAESGPAATLAPFGVDQATESALRFVPGAAVAARTLARRGHDIVVVDNATGAVACASLGDLPSADVDLSQSTVLASGPAAVAYFERAADEWRVLTAVAQAGLAAAALDQATDYVTERHQFGVPVGSFQAIKHALADRFSEVTCARLLAYAAAEALETSASDGSALAAMALAYAGEVAERTAADLVHFHGGYGVMLEYAAPFYLARAKAWRLSAGSVPTQWRVAAERLWPTTSEGTPALRRRQDPSAEAFRAEVRGFIDEHVSDELIARCWESGTIHDAALHTELCRRGYLAAGWPTEVGGGGRSEIETTVLVQELFARGAPVDAMAIASMVGATLMLVGTEQHRTEVVAGILSGNILCSLGYSEPDAGSDVAAAVTRAVPDGDEWVINGQKMFTSMAHIADYVLLLARTGPHKHRDLTMFLIPLTTPGIAITPVHTFGGERTNVSFYTDVRIPDSCRVGEVGAGWSVMAAALVYERNSANWGEPAAFVDHVAAHHFAQGRLDPLVAVPLARFATILEACRLLLFASITSSSTGTLSMVAASMTKLMASETFVAATGQLADLVGPDALRRDAGPLGHRMEHAFRHSQVTTIYAGSSEIQRNIIAEQGLGLPRVRSAT